MGLKGTARALAPVLRQRDFRLLWLAGLVSDAGDWLLFIALPIVVYARTGSALGTSIAFLAELAPGILLARLAGRLADRCDRRRLMLAITLAQTVVLLPLLAVGGRGSLPVVYGVLAGAAALSTLFDPAKNALLPTLVPQTELVSANSMVGLNENLGRLIGGPLGGLLLAVGGLTLVVVADAASFALAALALARLSGPSARAARSPSAATTGNGGPTPPSGPRAEVRAARRRPIAAGLVVAFTGQAAQGIFVVLFMLFVARRLGGGAGEIGLLRGVQAIGAIAGGVLLGFVARGASPVRLTARSAVAFGLITLVVWNAPLLSTATAVYVGLFILVGAPGVLMVTGMVTSFQLASDDGDRGQVFGALGLVGNAGQAIGIIAAGLLTAPLGLMTLLDTQGVLYLVAGGLAAAWM
jgi:predicted MFS family arabinose efflux permease